MSETVGAEGWTIVHQARQKHYDDRFYGQFLGTREGRIGGAEWVVGRLYNGKSADDGFRDGEWAYSRRFQSPNSTDSADAALKAYVEMSYDTFVWDRIFEQRAGEAIDRHLAGPEVDGAPKLSAGWSESDAGHRVPAAGSTISLPFHEAKYYLLQFLRSTELGAKAHLTRGITLDRHQAVDLVTKATGPVRFEYGYNTYWLAAEES
ncbi:hypothetical protein [Actinacidiphila sp. ITFR-21]|uniref:hypothetical protein n=1 Tax=Actinacidiphila sp. ITFR-21 TaxID=3075199 RepID=UPI00288A3096|nr:hypothetical protein [Streptomyces sp. ITFR-21]WNI17678.1 hypothetical protein RLT57_20525 [Streptomyces sp. ITFR-21]WNI17818.1 hypothetical protein RLT57_21240 [Streptomyces sp. ITFR-21]